MNYSTQKTVTLIYNLHMKYRGLLTAKEAGIISMIVLTEVAGIDPKFSLKEVDYPAAEATVMQMVRDTVDAVLKRQNELRAIGGLTSTKAQKETGIRINRDN